MLTDFEVQQLTNQSECIIHTHPSVPLDQLSEGQRQEATPVTSVVDGSTLTKAQDVISVDPAGGSASITLPPALRSKEYHVTMVGTGALTVTPNGTDTILGEPDMIITEQWTSIHLKADNNGNWIAL